MKYLIVIGFGILFCQCSSKKNDLKSIRLVSEQTEKIVVDYNFCCYEKDYKMMRKKLFNFVSTIKNEDFFNYCSSHSIKNKKTLTSILLRNLCKLKQSATIPQQQMSDKHFHKYIESSIEEILLEEEGITIIRRDKKGKIIYKGKR